MQKRIACIVALLLLSCNLCIAPVAWADVGDIQISSEDDSAVIEGCDFALSDFQRASAGSNREIGGEYYGYAYYIGSKPTDVMAMATDSLVVVYVDPAAAGSIGIDVDDEDAEAFLKEYIVALDEVNSKGGATMSEDMDWRFTTETALKVDGVIYAFNEELEPGSYYNRIIGTDGEDVTDPDHDPYVKASHACFAELVLEGDAIIVAQPGALEQFASFMETLDWSPLWVTLRTTLTAIVFIFILGLAAAYFCVHRTPRMRNIFDTIFTIPMVLPPTVCGFLLLLALGTRTPIGKWFSSIGFPLVFSWQATVIAAVVVAFPLMYRNALGAFDNLDSNMLDAARTLGWSEPKIFFKLMLPLSWSSIAAGTVLAFARALGEFGATLFLAGNQVGITRTIPIAIYFEWMNGSSGAAMFWTVILIIFSFVVILFINLWSQHTTRYRKGAVEE